MISLDSMKIRVISCVAQKGGKASKAEIIQNTAGRKARLIQIIDHLVAEGTLLKAGAGRKGNPHSFSLRAVQRKDSHEDDSLHITVFI